jgi:hypothetical protein
MDGPTAVIPQAERQQSRRKHAFVPARKLSKAFARSAPQTPAQAASWDNSSSSISTFILSPPHSPTTTISKAERRKSQRVVSPQVVSSILDSMYAYPVNRESNRLSLPKYQDKASLHHKSSLGTGASRICRCSAFYSSGIYLKLHAPRSGCVQTIVRKVPSPPIPHHQNETQYSGTHLQQRLFLQ